MDWYDIVYKTPLAELAPLAVYIVFSFIFGSCLGSFLNVCIWRIPLGESVVIVPSHCPQCNHKIRWFDNVPVIGYLALGGKCRDCQKKIPPRYIIMELLVGGLFTVQAILIYLTNGAFATLIALTIALSVAVPCAFIDVEHRKLPDKLTYFGMIAGVLYNWCFPQAHNFTHPDALLFSLSGLFSGVIGLGIFAWITGKLLKQRTLGGGDIKYAGFLGALFGVPCLLVTLLFSSILALLWAALQKIRRRETPSSPTVPFGPFLGIALYLYMLIILLMAAPIAR